MKIWTRKIIKREFHRRIFSLSVDQQVFSELCLAIISISQDKNKITSLFFFRLRRSIPGEGERESEKKCTNVAQMPGRDREREREKN